MDSGRLPNNFASWLKDIMRRNRVTNKQLAVVLDCSTGYISHLRSGRNYPTSRQLSLLATFFRIEKKNIPGSVRNTLKDMGGIAESIHVLDHDIPDHSLLVSETLRQIFLSYQLDIECDNILTQPNGYPQNCYESIDRALYKSRSAIVCGPKSFFGKRQGVEPVEFFSHRYKGYSMITRSSMQIDPVFGCYNEDIPRKFRSLLDIFSECRLWRGESCQDRVACIGLEEVRFISAIEGIKNELFNSEPFNMGDLKYPKDFALRSNRMLDKLDQPGSRGFDIVVGDAMCLSSAIAKPDKYKIIFTLGDMRRLVEYIGSNGYSGWEKHLQHAYKMECPKEAIRHFHDKWKKIISDLEMPVFWFLYMPNYWEVDRREKLQNSVSAALKESHNSLQVASSRTQILQEIYNHISTTHTQSCDIDSFNHAWNESYIGI